ncbi:MAG: SGNH/GDSL hydrolase family protein [Acholeplasmataceae bacterium]|jgi:lysophospholipase L1-like esterase|nr:SGNH/GDSL hydrolase family protein [Acholeplasmataceae bacterium]
MKRNVAIFGDSILRGVILDEESGKYRFSNHIDWESIEHNLNIKIDNNAKMGAVIGYGKKKLKNYLNAHDDVFAVLIEFGGNDCDFDWRKVANNPKYDHQPKTPLNEFKNTLIEMIDMLQEKNIKPILMNLPPIHSKLYYDWIRRDIENGDNILEFLGDIEQITRHQSRYSNAIVEVANLKKVELVNVRNAFLSTRSYLTYICKDGIHPNQKGGKLVLDVFLDYYKSGIK